MDSRYIGVGEINVLWFAVNLVGATWSSQPDPKPMFDKVRNNQVASNKQTSDDLHSSVTTSFGTHMDNFLLSARKGYEYFSSAVSDFDVLLKDGSFGYYGIYNTAVSATGCASALAPISASVQTQFNDDVWWNGDGGKVIRILLWTPAMTTICKSAWVEFPL